MAKGLGKGISALFPSEDVHNGESVELIALAKIDTNPFQPRKIFNDETLNELAISIREHGSVVIAQLILQGLPKFLLS